ncbi:hypothetical protein [Duganella callida]|uniref:M50 family peptidase n=1 Tax=Duganella callida TaxID=2561932 RepID=A0A4Y9S7E4_9BURK|nr:hypothetical protein [Duganella callida]TFW16004.1 hypothetical protein E4L98_25255 [Duganella callida]
MNSLFECSVWAPAWLCSHRDMLIYLAPSVLLALLIRALAVRHPFFLLFRLAGTISHELAHLIAGTLTGARPAAFTVKPRRIKQGWELGSVHLTNVRWYNAAPSALAPFVVVLLPFAVAWWRTRSGLNFQWVDIALAFAVAPQFLAFWPSSADWKIALQSWPYLLIAACLWWLL